LADAVRSPFWPRSIRTFKWIEPNASLIDLRVLDANGESSDSAAIAAIERAVALKSRYNIRVINLSLGRPVYGSWFRADSVAMDHGTGQTFVSTYDAFTAGAGYLDVSAAMASTDVANGSAASPRIVFTPSTGAAHLAHSLTASGTLAVWGTPAVWGTSLSEYAA
jgi:hypothetical protein